VAPNAGHVLHMEDPTLFNRELVKFLKADVTAPTQNGR
jgi:pimeloyl-ACP methyl ester carboxylesterase